jgi:hypothetical protein
MPNSLGCNSNPVGMAVIWLKPLLDVYLARPINGAAMKIKNSLPLVSTNG